MTLDSTVELHLTATALVKYDLIIGQNVFKVFAKAIK